MYIIKIYMLSTYFSARFSAVIAIGQLSMYWSESDSHSVSRSFMSTPSFVPHRMSRTANGAFEVHD